MFDLRQLTDVRPLYFKLGRRRGTILVMKARQLIDGCSFGPEALKAIGQAFDTAWQEIAGNFGSDAVEVEAARLQLASALLSIANEENRGLSAAPKTRARNRLNSRGDQNIAGVPLCL
jgi:hypothetical protein